MNHIKNKTEGKKRPSVIWKALVCFSHSLYHVVGDSILGRSFTAYRRADAKLHHERRRALRDDCRPMSPRRAAVLEAVRGSGLFKFFATISSAAAHGPARFYGQFILFYSALGALIHAIEAYIRVEEKINIPLLIIYLSMALMSLPLLFTKRSAVELLIQGRLTRWFFVGLLGLPEDQLAHAAESRRHTGLQKITPYVAFLLAVLAAVLTLWIPPLIVPAAFLLLGLTGMIMAFPETGILLSVMTLPLTLWSNVAFGAMAFLILVTWIGYGIKLLLMRRAIYFNLLDVAVLIFGGAFCLAGFTGAYVTLESVLRGLLGFLIISLYFLITNLMTTRQQQRRCLVGPLVTLGILIVMTLIAAIPSHEPNWLEGSRAGDAIIEAFLAVQTVCREHLRPQDICILLAAIPFIAGLLARQKRLRYKIALLLLLLTCGACLWFWGSLSGLIVALLSLLLFFLLFSHRNFAALLLSLPALACGGVWLYATFEDTIQRGLVRIFEGVHRRGPIWQGTWQAVCDHPYGIGLGSHAVTSVLPSYVESGATAVTETSGLYMTLLLKMGIPGLVILLFVIFLFLQKTFTSLGVSERREDSLMVLSGTVSLLALLGFGILSDAPAAMSTMLLACIILGICSAKENTVLEAWDTTTVSMACSENRVDMMMHHPGV
ncbi:MAG: hypothetical protein E7645_00835 [Ruminococcaceae bacterium]|nr:hypothetical protein [Oscillospiraceae bacterium]